MKVKNKLVYFEALIKTLNEKEGEGNTIKTFTLYCPQVTSTGVMSRLANSFFKTSTEINTCWNNKLGTVFGQM